jgi:hypothetical protein
VRLSPATPPQRHDIVRHAGPAPLVELAGERAGHVGEAEPHGIEDASLELRVARLRRGSRTRQRAAFGRRGRQGLAHHARGFRRKLAGACFFGGLWIQLSRVQTPSVTPENS